MSRAQSFRTAVRLLAVAQAAVREAHNELAELSPVAMECQRLHGIVGELRDQIIEKAGREAAVEHAKREGG